ncbi:MAG: alpha/beta hydrolase family protein [Promethearchaeota archaeon]
MANDELIIITLLVLTIAILIIRYLEIVPRLIFWYFAHDLENHTLETPNDLGLIAELVEIPVPVNQSSLTAWFFKSETASNEAGVLMVPNWYTKEDQNYSLRTAGLLCQAGYNVLLPVYHWRFHDNQWIFEKRSACPKNCQTLIQKAHEYFCTRPEINKRNIGIWSNEAGTFLASQLVKTLPIKAIVLEDGPVSLWNLISARLNSGKYLLPRIFLYILLFPFLKRTRWQGKNVVKNIRTCPSFLLANTLDDPQKRLWTTYFQLHKPRQLWFEHTLHSKALRDTWLQEYWLQVKSFFDLWLLNVTREEQPELHYDYSVKGKIKGFHQVEVRISVIPPALTQIPLQILFSDNHHFTERRIWFGPGASSVITWPLKYRPNNMSIIKFLNVESSESTGHQWMKRDAEKALYTTIEKMVSYKPKDLADLMDRYFIQKSILLNEQFRKEDAQKTLKTDITSKYWKNYLSRDAETRLILDDDLDEVATTTDSFFVST